MIGGGADVAPEHRAHAIEQNCPVGTRAETPFDKRVPGVAQGVGLGHAADELHGVVQALDLIVVHGLPRNDIDRLRFILERGLRLAGTGCRRLPIATLVSEPFGIDRGGWQAGRWPNRRRGQS